MAQYPASLPHLGLVLGPTHSTLTAEQGSYSVTGQDAGLASAAGAPGPLPHLALLGGLGRSTQSLENGSYTFTGQDVAFTRTYRLIANTGAYAGNYQPALLGLQGAGVGAPASLPIWTTLLTGAGAFTLTADPGIYSITGSDSIADFEVTAAQSSYSLTGQDAGLLATRLLTAESGTYSLTGQDAGSSITGEALTMPADTSTYSVTGQDASLKVGYRLSAEHGFYAVQGQANQFSFGVANVYVLDADGTTYSITGQSATLTYSGRILYAEVGAYEIRGQPVETPRQLRRNTGAGKRRKSKKYIARYRGQEYEFSTEEAMEAFVEEKLAEEVEKPVKQRAAVTVREYEEDEDDALMLLL